MRQIILILFLSSAIIISPNQIDAKKAPGFALFNSKGKLISLSKLTKNGNILISFWASYCKPCIKEMPHLVALEKKYGTTNNFILIFINTDKEGKEKALPILQQKNVSNECLYDIYQMTLKKFVPSLKVPALFLINKKNSIVFKAIGNEKSTLDKLERAIKRLR